MESWLSRKIALVEDQSDPFHPVIRDFQRLIEEDPIIFIGFHEMFDQLYARMPLHNESIVKSEVMMLSVLILTRFNPITASIGMRLQDHDEAFKPRPHYGSYLRRR